MDARQAHTLQQHALDTLAELRSWLGAREAALAPVAAERAQQAAYASWGAQVDAALRAVSKAFPQCERRSSPPAVPAEPDVDSAPPTLPSRGAVRSGWLPPPSADVLLSTRPQPSSSAVSFRT